MRTVQVVVAVALFGVGLVLGIRVGEDGGTKRATVGDVQAAVAAATANTDALRREVQELGARLDRARARTPRDARTDETETGAEPPTRSIDDLDGGSAPPVELPAANSTASPRVPPLPVPGAEEVLARVDVPLLAGLGRSLQRVGRFQLAERDGKDPDELPDELRNGVYGLLSTAAADLSGGEANTWTWPELSHPAVLANLIVQQLGDHGLPASETVRGRLADAARRWAAEAVRRERGHAETERDGGRVPRLRRMVDRMDVNLGFVDEAFALLSHEQSEAIRPPETRGLAYADPYVASATVDNSLYGGHNASPEGLAMLLVPRSPIPDSEWDAVVAIGNEWAASLAADERGVPARGAYGPDMELIGATRVHATAAAQARLIERLLAELDLPADVVDKLVAHHEVTFFRSEAPPR